MDVEVDSPAVSTSTAGSADANVDANVTALNIVDVGASSATAPTNGCLSVPGGGASVSDGRPSAGSCSAAVRCS